MIRFMVPLRPETKSALWELAQREHRDIRDQAALLIDEALAARSHNTERVAELRLVVSVDGQEVKIRPEVQHVAA